MFFGGNQSFEPRKTASQATWRKLLRSGGGGVKSYRSLQQGAGALNNKMLLLIKKNQISQGI